MPLILLIVGLLMFVGLVVIHEYGHFIAARRNGVEVEEFGIGFPPRAKILAKKNGTVYSLNWLPLGGFVKLKGEHDSDTEKGTFGAASLLTKVKIMLAGVTMNLLTAFVLLTIAAFVGIPKVIDNQFTVPSDTKIARQEVLMAYVQPEGPAGQAGLKPLDQLVSIKGDGETVAITSEKQLPEVSKRFAGKNVQLEVRRDSATLLLSTTLRSEQEVTESKNTDTPKGYLGVAPRDFTLQKSTWSAPIVAGGLIKQFTVMTLKALGNALANLVRGDTAKASSEVAGPVGIFFVFREGSNLGYEFILLIVALISLTLAIMNVLPIPALDGGRLFVTLLFRVINKPLKQNIEDAIHGTGFALLMLLFIMITVVDVRRFF